MSSDIGSSAEHVRCSTRKLVSPLATRLPALFFLLLFLSPFAVAARRCADARNAGASGHARVADGQPKLVGRRGRRIARAWCRRQVRARRPLVRRVFSHSRRTLRARPLVTTAELAPTFAAARPRLADLALACSLSAPAARSRRRCSCRLGTQRRRSGRARRRCPTASAVPFRWQERSTR